MQLEIQEWANKAINVDVKMLRRSFLAMQFYASGYGKGYRWSTNDAMEYELLSTHPP